MLVLSRRRKEKIVINDDIVITVVDIDRNGQVRLGIDAPKQYRVLRHELYEQVQEENRQAAEARSISPAMLANLRFPKPPAHGEED